MAFKQGDRVFVRMRDHRTDNEVTYTTIVGHVVEAFNAWHPDTGDCWQYRIKGDTGYVFFDEIKDSGDIELRGRE